MLLVSGVMLTDVFRLFTVELSFSSLNPPCWGEPVFVVM